MSCSAVDTEALLKVFSALFSENVQSVSERSVQLFSIAEQVSYYPPRRTFYYGTYVVKYVLSKWYLSPAGARYARGSRDPPGGLP